ncbi:hypothetical protein HN011_007680 [Eciton burchellii]|nr:hypothetical protein HN011_007680 [Eciton burchellii]
MIKLIKLKRSVIMSPILGIFLFISVAVAGMTNNVQQCTTNAQCPSTHCCLLGPSRYAIPVCMPTQQKGEQCRVNADTITTNLTYPDSSQLEVKGIHFILCPCANELSCGPNGICN